MKKAMKENAPFQHEGIMSISRSLSGNVDAQVKKWVKSAKRQGQDIDKMSEQELKYLIELNKPQSPKVISADSPEGRGITEALFGKRGKVIKADFGKPFAEEVVTVERVITDIKKLDPIEAMKETNKVLKGEGRYKSLSKADREKIAGDESVTDHIFERNIVDETEDFASGGKVKESWTDKLTRWGGGPSVLAGELGLEGINQIYQLLNMPGLYNKGGRAGLSYLLAEDTNERTPLAGGGSGKPPINFYVDFSASGGKEAQNIYGVKGLNEKGYDYGGTFAADTTFPLFGGELSVGGELGIGRDKSDVDYKGQPIDWLSNVGETKLGDNWNVGAKWRKKFAGGGMGRRAFLKLMAALGATGAAAKYGLAGLLKGGGKQVAKELTSVPIKNVDGMPAWFKPLVNKVIKEGDDVTKKFATKDREIVNATKIGDDEMVTVYRDLDDGTVRVEYDSVDNLAEGPVQLEFKPGMADETTKGKKPPDKFTASESEPEIVNWDGDIDWTGENLVDNVADLTSDTTKLKEYAVGKEKITVKEIVESIKKKKRTQKINEDPTEQINYIENKEGYGAMEYIDESERVGAFENRGYETKGMNLPQKKASGGRVPLAGGGGIMKLIKKLLAKTQNKKLPWWKRMGFDNQLLPMGVEKVAKHAVKNPIDAAAAAATGTLIARSLHKDKKASGGIARILGE